jgi:Tfp pilus assembly protein FimV
MALAVQLSSPPPRRALRLAPQPVALDRPRYGCRRLAAVAVLSAALVTTSTVVHAVGAALVHDPVAQAATPVPAAPHTLRLVQPGETLWSIAGDLRPSADRRAAVDELVRLNGSTTIIAGQPILVPAGWSAS